MGKFAGLIDAGAEIELVFGGVHLGDVDVEIANRVMSASLMGNG